MKFARPCAWGYIDKNEVWVECGKYAEPGYGMCAKHLDYDARTDKRFMEMEQRTIKRMNKVARGSGDVPHPFQGVLHNKQGGRHE